MSAMGSQLTSLMVVYWTVYSRIHQSSASLAVVRGIHRSPVNSPHKGTVTRKMLPFDAFHLLESKYTRKEISKSSKRLYINSCQYSHFAWVSNPLSFQFVSLWICPNLVQSRGVEPTILWEYTRLYEIYGNHWQTILTCGHRSCTCIIANTW